MRPRSPQDHVVNVTLLSHHSSEADGVVRPKHTGKFSLQLPDVYSYYGYSVSPEMQKKKISVIRPGNSEALPALEDLYPSRDTSIKRVVRDGGQQHALV